MSILAGGSSSLRDSQSDQTNDSKVVIQSRCKSIVRSIPSFEDTEAMSPLLVQVDVSAGSLEPFRIESLVNSRIIRAFSNRVISR